MVLIAGAEACAACAAAPATSTPPEARAVTVEVGEAPGSHGVPYGIEQRCAPAAGPRTEAVGSTALALFAAEPDAQEVLFAVELEAQVFDFA